MKHWLARCGLGLAMLVAAPVATAHEYRSFESDGVKLAYVDYGAGTPVIFLHGFRGDFQRGAAATADSLGAGFRIIGLDQRGHGRSGKPHGDHDYGLHLADDVLNLMNHLGLEKAHLVAHSMGGIVGMYLAVHFPQRLYSMTTIGNGLFSVGELELINWLMRGKFLWEDFKALAGINVPLREPGYDAQALKLTVASLRDLAVTPEEAAAISLPILAARGGPEDDPRSTVERLAKANPAVQMLRIETEDHMSMLKNVQLLGALKQFLQKNNPPLPLEPAA